MGIKSGGDAKSFEEMANEMDATPETVVEKTKEVEADTALDTPTDNVSNEKTN